MNRAKKSLTSAIIALFSLALTGCAFSENYETANTSKEEYLNVPQYPIDKTSDEDDTDNAANNKGANKNTPTMPEIPQNVKWITEPFWEFKNISICCEFPRTETGEADIRNFDAINAAFETIGPFLCAGHGRAWNEYFYDAENEIFIEVYVHYNISEFNTYTAEEFSRHVAHWDFGRLRALRLASIDEIEIVVENNYISWGETDFGKFAIANGSQILSDFIFEFDTSRVGGVMYDSFGNGVISVSLDGKWGLLDESANIVLPFIFEDLEFINADAAFAKYDGRYGIIDLSLIYQKTDDMAFEYGLYLAYLESDEWAWMPDPFGERPYEMMNFIAYGSKFVISATRILDFDGDGVLDLWFRAQDTDYSESFGGPTITGFCTIIDGKVVRLLHGYISGGSIGGNYVTSGYDQETSEHILVLRGFAGGFGGRASYAKCFSMENGELTELYEIWHTHYWADWEAEHGYGEDEEIFMVNGEEVSEEIFNKIASRFIDPISQYFVLQ